MASHDLYRLVGLLLICIVVTISFFLWASIYVVAARNGLKVRRERHRGPIELERLAAQLDEASSRLTSPDENIR